MAINREAIGRKGAPAPFEITAERIVKYARATNEDNPLFVDPSRDHGDGAGNLLAPPCFAFTIASPSMAKVLMAKDLGINFLRLVHGEQEFRYHQPLWSGRTVQTEAELVDVQAKETGETFTIATKTCSDEGTLLSEARFTFFIRGSGGGRAKSAEPEPARQYLFQTPMEVASDQATRYGHASGDLNPIHMSDKAGKAAGLGGVILHGLCTMAFASQAIVDGCLDGDARRLALLRVRFSKPVRPGDTVTTRVWSEGEGRVGFDAVLQDGTVVLKNGAAAFHPAR